MVTAAHPPHMIADKFIIGNRRSAMAKAQALPIALTKAFHFSLIVSAFVFISVLVAGLHP